MGHAAHFLRRVDRLSGAHVELALGLYRDEELVKHVLSRAHLPPQAERVALSLDDPREGPFIIVTRNGQFVTCLGRGMRVNRAQPVVTRRTIDHVSEEVVGLRRLLTEAATGERANSTQLIMRVFESGSRLSREDFDELTAWTPLLAGVYLQALVDATQAMNETYEALCDRNRGRKRHRPALLAYWRACWGAHHLQGLLATYERCMTALFDDAAKTGKIDSLIYFVAEPMRSAARPFALRGAWFAAKLPGVFMPSLRRMYDYPMGSDYLLATRLALAAIGIRHPRRRREVFEQLSRPPAAAGLGEVPGAPAAEDFLTCLDERLIQEERRRLPVATDVDIARLAPDLDAAARRQLQISPSELRVAYLASLQQPLFEESRDPGSGLAWLQQVASSEARDFYLPRRYLPRSAGFELKHALKLVEMRRRAENVPSQTLQLTQRRPGRNDSCNCGSGKKYKRCCGNN